MSTAYQDLAEKIFFLEQRVARLEAEQKAVSLPLREEKRIDEQRPQQIDEMEAGIESNIGEYGLAWIGNIVLFLGIVFLVEYLRISGFNSFAHIFGLASLPAIFGLAWYFRKTNPNMAGIFSLNGYLLTFYVILKLHFFSANPLITSKAGGLILLLIVSAIFLYLSMRRAYPVLTGLSLIFLAVTAVLSDSTHLMLSIASLIAATAVILLYRVGWIWIVYLSIFLVYLLHFLWIFNNPFLGHSLMIIQNHQYGFLHLLLATSIFSMIALVPQHEGSFNSDDITAAVIFYGVGFAFMTGMNVLSFFKDNYFLFTGIVSLLLIVFSVVLEIRSKWKLTAGLYALSGFVALSISIYGIYKFPAAYILLAVQSLLVVSIAIWFRSRFIVVMNSLMYIVLLIIYLSTAHSGNGINIAFSIVALVTARVLNWKKERLTIQTDVIRNLYLITAFFMILFSIYHLVPKEYITLSWTVAGVFYFLLSLLLKNIKYRYMALGTMISAALFLFMVDLARVELIFRIIALLFLAIISIAISFYYFNKKQMKQVKD